MVIFLSSVAVAGVESTARLFLNPEGLGGGGSAGSSCGADTEEGGGGGLEVRDGGGGGTDALLDSGGGGLEIRDGGGGGGMDALLVGGGGGIEPPVRGFSEMSDAGDVLCGILSAVEAPAVAGGASRIPQYLQRTASRGTSLLQAGQILVWIITLLAPKVSL
jgi:hypothetical protein